MVQTATGVGATFRIIAKRTQLFVFLVQIPSLLKLTRKSTYRCNTQKTQTNILHHRLAFMQQDASSSLDNYTIIQS